MTTKEAAENYMREFDLKEELEQNPELLRIIIRYLADLSDDVILRNYALRLITWVEITDMSLRSEIKRALWVTASELLGESKGETELEPLLWLSIIHWGAMADIDELPKIIKFLNSPASQKTKQCALQRIKYAGDVEIIPKNQQFALLREKVTNILYDITLYKKFNDASDLAFYMNAIGAAAVLSVDELPKLVSNYKENTIIISNMIKKLKKIHQYENNNVVQETIKVLSGFLDIKDDEE